MSRTSAYLALFWLSGTCNTVKAISLGVAPILAESPSDGTRRKHEDTCEDRREDAITLLQTKAVSVASSLEPSPNQPVSWDSHSVSQSVRQSVSQPVSQPGRNQPVSQSNSLSESSFSQSACEHFRSLYGLSRLNAPGNFVPHCYADNCALKLPSGWSNFTNGKLPVMLTTEKQQEMIKDRRWFNPSMVALPHDLRRHFPHGRYVAVGNVNAAKFLPNGSQLVIFDSNFEALVETRIDLQNAPSGQDDVQIMQRLIADARLVVNEHGTMTISFTPYSIKMLHSKHAAEHNWMCHQFVAILHVAKSSRGSLSAWVDHHEMRMLEMPQVQGRASATTAHCLKNLGYITGPRGQVDVVVFVHPTTVAQFHMDDLAAHKANKSAYVNPLILSSWSSAPALQTVPWKNAVLWHGHPPVHLVPPLLHNGPSPVWVEELQEYLGVGHFVRGVSDSKPFDQGGCYKGETDWNSHHYTHLFFTLSRGPGYHLQRLGKQEFCFQSSHTPDDCDAVQFVSGLVRDGEYLHLSYGVNDQKALVATVKVAFILDALEAVQ